jgi:hypothetical protein
MRVTSWIVSLCAVLSSSAVLAKGDGSFQAPLSIVLTGGKGAVTVHTGDFNHDGKLDLLVATGVASNQASGSSSILVLFQDPKNRQNWTQVPVRVGSSSVFVRGGDMDGDGIDDILVADLNTSAYFIHSNGDGTFGKPLAITKAPSARWIALGDWNSDGHLDLATANFNSNPPGITCFLNDGVPNFTLSQTLPGSREHTMESLDYDGDGHMDLLLGSGLPGVTPYKGTGDGKFLRKSDVGLFGCVEYISIGNLNNDGKDDIATTCIDDGSAYAGISLGTGQFRKTLGPFPAAAGTESDAIADLNGDGNGDVAVVSNGSTNLWVHPGKGDGTFFPPVVFGPTGLDPVFLIAEDIDEDGHPDVVSAEQQSATVTIFWGRTGTRFLESGYGVTGFSAAKAMAVGDLNLDGYPDLFFPQSSVGRIQVFLKPGGTAPTKPSLIITTLNKYTSLEVLDLDGDGVPDLAGSSSTDGMALVALLDTTGKTRNELALPAGVLAGPITVGRIDDGDQVDLAIPCAGSNYVSVFLGQGGGAFADAKNINTVEKPRDLALGDLDADGHTDMVVVAPTAVVIHFGKGAADFEDPVTLLTDLTKNYSDVAIADVSGDGIKDILITDQKTANVLLYRGKGSRQFEDPVSLKVNSYPVQLQVTDLDGDGKLDITTANTTTQSVSVLLNHGDQGFAPQVGYRVGFIPLGHRLADLDQDGALDLVAFSSANSMILLGRPQPGITGPFRRGDTNGDGAIDVTDTVLILNRLFLGGDLIPCEKAADANDDGVINLTDPINMLNRLFLGGEPLPPPGPADCGDDPNADTLDCVAHC